MSELSQIRGIALDFDGTLLEDGWNIRREARDALTRAADAGILIATASGRPPADQQRILEQNDLGRAAGFPHALSCDERSLWLLEAGAYAPYRPWNDYVEAEWERLMPVATRLIDEAYEACLAEGVAVQRHVEGELIRQRGIVDLRFATEEEATRRGHWLAARVAEVSDELTVTWNWMLVQVILRAAGKGNTLRELARLWGMRPRELLAVGDRNNDASMLDGSAGLTPAAVGNAVPEIKALVAANEGYLAQEPVGAGVAEIVDRVLSSR